MNESNRRKPIWALWLVLFAALVLVVAMLLRSAGAAGPLAVAALTGTPEFLPLMQNPPTPTPTATPEASATPIYVPPPNSVLMESYASPFNTSAITGIVNAGDERLFVLEREGLVRIVRPGGNIQAIPFLDLTNKVATSSWEEGLVGIVFHPDYVNNGYFYVTYTPIGANVLVLYRFERMPGDPNLADPNSGVRMMTIPKPSEYHHSGDMHFGPDGYLYISVGDGGPDPKPPGDPDAFPGDPQNNAQRLDEALGNILRIDVDGLSGGSPDLCTSGSGYTVPADNPYVDGPGGNCDEVWMSGLRNPWRFSFDSATGDMYIGDVGEWKREEVNYVAAGTGAGVNFGWHCYEGTLDYSTIWPSVAADCQQGGYAFPVHEYDHGQGCSITGGYVYRGSQIPGLQGHYLYGDLCSTKIFRISPTDGWQEVELVRSLVLVTVFGQDVNGELYAGGWDNQSLWKIRPAP